MFVLKSRLTVALARNDALRVERAEREQVLIQLQRQQEALHHQFTTANTQYARAVETLQAEVRSLLERLITSEAEGRKASALIALWSVRVNQLQVERDLLLTRVVPGLDIRTPQIGAVSQLDPTVSFEHEPGFGAAPDPNALYPVPEPEALGGLAGEVYTPSAEE